MNNNQDNYSENNPFGNTIEVYDIWMEQELMRKDELDYGRIDVSELHPND